MKPFARGQRSRLDALTPALDLVASLRIDAPGLVIDCCCFGLDERGQLSDDRFFVFYNQPAAPAGAIEQGAGGDFRVRLENLPQSIRRLVFTASIDGAGTMSQMRGGSFSLADSSGGERMRYEFSGQDFGSERALMVAEVYWKDGWRVWAEGQGFAGGLSALLRHFGGEEVSGDAPAPAAAVAVAQVPISVPPAPTSPPVALVSTSVAQAPAALASGATDAGTLQQLIDATPPGGTLRLGPGEFAGPIVLRRPLTLQGEGGVIWARSGPVVTVESAQVSLRDVEIQVTDSLANSGTAHGDVALLARISTGPSLSGLRVRGRVVGVGGAAGAWKLPDSLDLGTLAPRVPNAREIEVDVPAACALSCTLAGSKLEPTTLEAGVHRVRLWVREVPPGSFVCGRVEVRAGEVTRSIWISGRSE